MMVQDMHFNWPDSLCHGRFDIVPCWHSGLQNAGCIATGKIIELAITDPCGDTAHVFAGILIWSKVFELWKMFAGNTAYTRPDLSICRNITDFKQVLIFIWLF